MSSIIDWLGDLVAGEKYEIEDTFYGPYTFVADTETYSQATERKLIFMNNYGELEIFSAVDLSKLEIKQHRVLIKIEAWINVYGHNWTDYRWASLAHPSKAAADAADAVDEHQERVACIKVTGVEGEE